MRLLWLAYTTEVHCVIFCPNTRSIQLHNIKYEPGSQQANADSLSQLPLPDTLVTVPVPADMIKDTPVNASQIKNWTNCNSELSQVQEYIHHTCSWPSDYSVQNDIVLYSRHTCKIELLVEKDCIFGAAGW